MLDRKNRQALSFSLSTIAQAKGGDGGDWMPERALVMAMKFDGGGISLSATGREGL